MRALLVGVMLTLPGIAAAQPPELMALTQQSIRAVSGADAVDASNWCAVAQVTNMVAWRLWTNHTAPPPYGLLKKSPGQTRVSLHPDGSCISGQVSGEPDGFVGLDYLIERATGYGFDIVTSGGQATIIPELTETARNWDKFSDPIDPSTYLHTGPPPVPVPPPVVPVPVPPPPVPVIDLSGVQAQLTAIALELHEHVRADGDAHASINQNVTDGREENRSFFSAVAGHWKAIVGVIGPVYATWQTCHNTGKC